MLDHKLLSPEGILVLEPDTPLEAADFEGLANEIDPYIAEHGGLSGVMVHAKAFPGWADFEAALAHIRFIESHHQKIQRLAVVSDSLLLTELPKFARHLVHAEVKHFRESAYEDALQWLREAEIPANP
ncbi:MAG TPA: STAS/SEC14 domain-containing protein [Thermoguttaceae bacterium]|nr:STAS/SEC14 domain-containing protein [Thermoguttaceae bacterium]